MPVTFLLKKGVTCLRLAAYVARVSGRQPGVYRRVGLLERSQPLHLSRDAVPAPIQFHPAQYEIHAA
jgi:hypothetical protein